MNKEFDNIKLEMTIEKYLEKMERKLERILWKAKNEDTKEKLSERAEIFNEK